MSIINLRIGRNQSLSSCKLSETELEWQWANRDNSARAVIFYVFIFFSWFPSRMTMRTSSCTPRLVVRVTRLISCGLSSFRPIGSLPGLLTPLAALRSDRHRAVPSCTVEFDGWDLHPRAQPPSRAAAARLDFRRGEPGRSSSTLAKLSHNPESSTKTATLID
jgi:hypothetical protein